MSLCVFPLHAQTDSVSSNETTLPVVIDETTLPIATEEASVTNEVRSPSMIALVFRMIFVLAFVIACIYVILKLIKKSGESTNDDQFLRLVSTVGLGQGKSVHIVSLLDEKAYMIGASDNAVNLIGEITNKELISAMNLYADKTTQTKKAKNFSDILSLFTGGKINSIFSGQGEEGANLLKKRRKSFNEGK